MHSLRDIKLALEPDPELSDGPLPGIDLRPLLQPPSFRLSICQNVGDFACSVPHLIIGNIEMRPSRSIGEIQSLELDWGDTVNDERVEWDHYDIEGTLGSGELVIRSEPQGPDSVEVLLAGELHLANGEVYDLLADYADEPEFDDF